MILIKKEGPHGDRQQQIDETLYTVQMTGAQLRQMARLSYKHEGGDEFPHDPNRVYNWVRSVEPDIDPTKNLDHGELIVSLYDPRRNFPG